MLITGLLYQKGPSHVMPEPHPWREAVFRERAPKKFLILAALVGNGFHPEIQGLKLGRKKKKYIVIAHGHWKEWEQKVQVKRPFTWMILSLWKRALTFKTTFEWQIRVPFPESRV